VPGCWSPSAAPCAARSAHGHCPCPCCSRAGRGG
jgi:hypothetical protein